MIRRLAKSLCEITGIPDYWFKSTIAEIRMALVRLYSLLPFQRHKLRRLYSNNEPIKLIFGCGDTSYRDWLGVDCFFSDKVEFVLDLRRKLPFESGSVDLCYSEHFIEHLWQKELMTHLSEVFRILKPGGRYRVVVPAALRFVERYAANDSAFFALAFPWAQRPMDAVRDIIYFAGDHRNVFDFDELAYLAKQVGFSIIRESSVNNSDIPQLRIDKGDDQRAAESLYVEMIKGSQ